MAGRQGREANLRVSRKIRKGIGITRLGGSLALRIGRYGSDGLRCANPSYKSPSPDPSPGDEEFWGWFSSIIAKRWKPAI